MKENQKIIIPEVPLELWRELYQAAAAFHALAPWAWTLDSYVFGLNNEHGVRLHSVLGNIKTMFGLVAYRGTAGARQLLNLLAGATLPEDDLQFGYVQNTLTLDFATKEFLQPEDKAVAAALKSKPFSGRPQRHIYFRSYRPGYYPWYLDKTEARASLDSFNHAIQFTTLLRKHPNLFAKRQPGEFPFLPNNIRVPLTVNQLEWHVLKPTPPEDEPCANPETFGATELVKFPQRKELEWEAGALYINAPILENGRPYWPKVSAVVDAKSGFAFNCELVGPNVTKVEATAKRLVETIRSQKHRPGIVYLGTDNLIQGLFLLCKTLGIEVVIDSRMPMFTEMYLSMENHLRSQRPI